MKKITVFIFLSALVLILPMTSCAHIYHNDRESKAHLRGPERKIGRLKLNRYWHEKGKVVEFSCTAFLVSKNLIMTNAHCLERDKQPSEMTRPLQDGEKPPQTPNDLENIISFELGLNGVGNYLAKSGIEKIVYYKHKDHRRYAATDFAILKLKEDLGTKYGWLKTASFRDKDEMAYDHWNKLKISGYSSLFHDYKWTLTTNSGHCTFKSYMTDKYGLTFYHDCDSAMGDSGAPIYICPKDKKECYVLGIQARGKTLKGEGTDLILDKYEKKYAHVAVDTEEFRELVKYFSQIYNDPQQARLYNNNLDAVLGTTVRGKAGNVPIYAGLHSISDQNPSDIIATAKLGSPLRVLETYKLNWYLVVDEKGNEGWIEKSSLKQASATTLEQMGDDFYYGYHDVTKSYTQALKCYRKAADKGNVQSMYSLGHMYGHGEGVNKKYTQAAQWYRKAAENGHGQGMHQLAYSYSHGQGVDKNDRQALKWYRKAAALDNTQSMYNIGQIYTNSPSIKQDYAQAIKWFRKAAERGHKSAMGNLGVMYVQGQGVKKDFGQAMKWFQKAAAKGHAKSMFLLGLMYEKGMAVKADTTTAISWYRQAATKGSKDATKQLQRLKVKL